MAKTSFTVTCFVILMYHVCIAIGSYLDPPQIHFYGNFRADTNTRNNDRCSFDPNFNGEPDSNWNPRGTSEISFENTYVTAAVNVNHKKDEQDPVLRAFIVTNLDRPYAKLVDLDVDCQNNKSTIYGMKLGLSWDKEGKHYAFMGTWTPSVVSQDIWKRILCYTPGPPYPGGGNHAVGTYSTTKLTSIKWGNLRKSKSLEELKQKAGENGELSIRVSFYNFIYHDKPDKKHKFSLGNVIGTIGVYKKGEALNVGGERIMTPESSYVSTPIVYAYAPSVSCTNVQPPWVYNAYFKVRDAYGSDGKKEIAIDFINSLPLNPDFSLLNIGELYVGYMDVDQTGFGNCIQLINPHQKIRYREDNWLKSGAIEVIPLEIREHNILKSTPLMVIQKVHEDLVAFTNKIYYPLCGDAEIPSISRLKEAAIIILKEREYFVRPFDFHVDRLEDGKKSKKSLLVTKYGEIPDPPVSVKILPCKEVIPQNGVSVDSEIKSTTKKTNLVEFKFTACATNISPGIREYPPQALPECNGKKMSKLPIDGQIYFFRYCIIDDKNNCRDTSEADPSNVIEISFLVYPIIKETQYDWIHNIKPIFTRYKRLAPVMSSIIDLSNFTAVTLEWNRELIKYSMTLEFDDVNYMPVTRDLSPTQMDLIKTWLENPIYDRNTKNPKKSDDQDRDSKCKVEENIEHYNNLERCNGELIYGNDQKIEQIDGYIYSLYFSLEEYGAPSETFDECTSLQDLMENLQKAVETEFYTIPIYLTALYSIIDGCNSDIYDTLRAVAMEEMMHFAQAANILLAIGGKPKIDGAQYAPKYGKNSHLPGGILPKLDVNLKKLSLEHVHKVFMAIEAPISKNKHTIGYFYQSVLSCMKKLDNTNNIFENANKRVKYQVTWPWEGGSYVGNIIKVESLNDAERAINNIIHQGEGASELNPKSGVVPKEYAHYYRFEEIVCQRRLVRHDDYYEYKGDKITFNPKGVWPMRDNPKSESIIPNTNCYTESLVFHHVYRAFLRKLQEAFTPCDSEGCVKPEKLLMKSIELMEALQVHAKKLMKIKYNPDDNNDPTTCGPVWDYEFKVTEDQDKA